MFNGSVSLLAGVGISKPVALHLSCIDDRLTLIEILPPVCLVSVQNWVRHGVGANYLDALINLYAYLKPP